MDRHRDNRICRTGLVHTEFFLLEVCSPVVGHVLDNLEALYDDVVDKVALASQPILAYVTIEGTNNV